MSSDPHHSMAGRDTSNVAESSLDFSLSYSLYSGGSLMQPPALAPRTPDHDVVVGVHPGHQRPPHLSHHVAHQTHQPSPQPHQQTHPTHPSHLSHQTSHHAHPGPPLLGHQMAHLPHQTSGHPHQGAGHPHQGAGHPHQGAGHSHQGAGHPLQSGGHPHQGAGHPHQNSPHQHQASPHQQHQGSPLPHQGSPHPHQTSTMSHQSSPHAHQGPQHHHQGSQLHHQGSTRHHQPPSHLPHQGTHPAHHGLQSSHHQQQQQQQQQHSGHQSHQTHPAQHLRQGTGPGLAGQGPAVPHTPTLGDTWRNVGYDEAVESSKRQLNLTAPNAFARSPIPEKRPRTDGAFNGDSLLFKSTLEGAMKIESSSADLLSGISESFDFASSGDAPDDNSSLAQSISLIQQTLDQSIAQAECLGSSPQTSSHVNSDLSEGHDRPVRLEDPHQRDHQSAVPTPSLASAVTGPDQLFVPRSPLLLSSQSSIANCAPPQSLPPPPLQQQPSHVNALSQTSSMTPPSMRSAPSAPRPPPLHNGGPASTNLLTLGSSSSYDSLMPVDPNAPVTLKEYRLIFTEQVFEKNGQIIRRQLVQREQVLERTLQLTAKQMEGVLQFGPASLGPCEGPDSGAMADISSSERSPSRSLPSAKTVVMKSPKPAIEVADLTPSTPAKASTVLVDTERRSSIEDSPTTSPTVAVKIAPSAIVVENGKATPAALPPAPTLLPAEDIKLDMKKALSIAATATSPKAQKDDEKDKEPTAAEKHDEVEKRKSKEESHMEKRQPRKADDEAGEEKEKKDKNEEMKDVSQSEEKSADGEARSSASVAAGSETDEAGSLTPGSMCLAQWSDKLFYLATIVKVYKNGRCVVNFADGTHDTVKAMQVVPMTELEAGQDVYVKVRNNFEFGVIKGKTMVNQTAGYVAELHNKRVLRITRDRIVLTVEMVNAYRERIKTKTPLTETRLSEVEKDLKISANNRGSSRRTRGLSSALDLTSPETEVERVGSRTRGVRYGRSEASVSGVASVSGGGVSGSSLNPPTLVFEGMGFLLTDTERTVKDFYSSSGTTTDNSPFDSASSNEQVEFNKEQLQALIEENGGVVFKSFSEAECASSLDTGIQERFLLARSHMKTLKYVLCLAAGIRCLGYQVVHAALREGKMPHFAKYQLPAGVSVLTKLPVEQPSVHSPIFADMTIAVVSEQNHFVNTWSQVIVAAGGRIVSKLPQRQSPQKSGTANKEPSATGPDGPIRFMVTQADCSSLSLRSARSLRVFPVSSEWVVQSIIHSKVLEPDAHPSFAHDFKKE
ncbi:hypothetical protein BIW11_11916 [Tropilaelaps mercedesae]|uniref:Tudor domain-containing protein n=1 Tax=Tropilaelaps mercedesae TaxID=418985 RepID=A0A1V9X9A3_9ACAR|nr:hypothetical protein BIW11_11916 [Tropilaelaps mercedesae]